MHSFEQLPWQRPNATEAYASEKMQGLADYFPFPWATWIDRERHGRPSKLPFPRISKTQGIRATVCQHIWALEHLELFQLAGITDIFWSHATKNLQTIGGIRIHPFPLYPVRCASHPPAEPAVHPSKRPLLFSFQGAYSASLYLTPVRQWLLELPQQPNNKLEQRQEWHYEQEVYREQVLGHSPNEARNHQLTTEADDYSSTMKKSCFALCPSGSGPNSIRLWEALGYGSIPVILSDNLQLPGPSELWQAATISIPETQKAVARLPRQLEDLASDKQRLLTMQQACQELWRLFGLPNFVGDVLRLLRDPLGTLRIRAIQQLGPDKPVEVKASQPTELPLLLLRNLRDEPPTRPVLIQIDDRSPQELIILRWQTALKLCRSQLVNRPVSVACTTPELEQFFNDKHHAQP